jgi:predicted AAA+ superfamily ATPase
MSLMKGDIIYFTIWAPRQTGKTWLMHQVKDEIKKRYGERFIVADMSMQSVDLEDKPVDEFLKWIPYLVEDAFNLQIEAPKDWMTCHHLFHKKRVKRVWMKWEKK